MTIPAAVVTDPRLPAVNLSAGLVMERRFSQGPWLDVRHFVQTKRVVLLRNPAC
jgi:hypothetical protein